MDKDKDKERDKGKDDVKTPEDKLCETIDADAKLKLKSKKEGKEILFGLGLFGIIGWSIAIPTLGGIALGVFLDRRYPTGFSWTLTLLFVGVVIGCFNAWHWIKDKSKED
jgi:ATP synthase protein I